MKSSKPRVLIGATEIFPLAKTGGLADATAALGAALAALDLDIHFVMPAYPQALELAGRIRASAPLPPVCGHEDGLLLSGLTPDTQLPLHLVDLPGLFRHGGELYVGDDGEERPDNPLRFAAFSQVIALLATGELGQAPFDVVHCNDWHTGLTPLLLLNQTRITPPATVFTIHNMAFQGQCPSEQWSQLAIDLGPGQWPRVEYYGQVSYLKAGIEFSDQLTTVSPRYADEIQTAEFGFGLEGVVQSRRGDLTGILNGIDASLWSPERSPWLPAAYSVDDMSGKAHCKNALQQALGLEANPHAPLMIFIGRLTWQKMADVLLEMLPAYLNAEPDRQFVLLGKGDHGLESDYKALAEAYPGRVSVLIDYTETWAHRLHAGADILIHGSRFEPCGLTQLYALRFGTIPVVRPVGGLADTVVDATPDHLASGHATGFYFEEPSAAAMLAGVDRAVALYRRADRWPALQRRAMTRDFSWTASARDYQRVYARALGQARQRAKPSG